MLQLDAHSPDGVRVVGTGSDVFLLDGDGDGQPGGDFRRRFDTLPGDITGGFRTAVDAADVHAIRGNLDTSVADAGTGPNGYFVWRDVNADGRIDVRDVAEVRRRMGTTLPFYEPTGTFAAQASTPVRTRPVSRTLFSSEPVLA